MVGVVAVHANALVCDAALVVVVDIIRRELQLAPEITNDLIRETLELAMGGGFAYKRKTLSCPIK